MSRICQWLSSGVTSLFSLSLLCTLTDVLQINRVSISLLILYLFFFTKCSLSWFWVLTVIRVVILCFPFWIIITSILLRNSSPLINRCQEFYLSKECGHIADTCCRRKTNVTHCLKLFGNRPLGFYIFFLVSVKSQMELTSFVTSLDSFFRRPSKWTILAY